MIVYKYRQASELTDKIFTTGKVWLSAPSALNDPFEAEIDLQKNSFGSPEDMQTAQVQAFLDAARRQRKAGKSFYGLSKQATYSLIERFKNLRDSQAAYGAYSSFVEKKTGLPPLDPNITYSAIPGQIASLGIFSLSETPDNSLMWAHYGGSHEGICLGFEVTDGSALADSTHCLHVTYSDDTLTINDVIAMELQMAEQISGKARKPGTALLSHPMIQTTIATKGLEWSYEREWRYVEFASGEHDWPAPIVEITFGLKCSAESREHYTDLVKKFVPNDVRLFEIVKIEGTRKIERVMTGIASSNNVLPIHAANLGLVRRLLDKRHFVAAISAVDEVLAAGGPNMAEALRLKGIALGWSNDHKGALSCFTEGVAIAPNEFSLRYQRAVALTALCRFDESIAEYVRAQELCPWEPSFPFNHGTLLYHLGRPHDALVQFAKASRLGHPRANDSIDRLRKGVDVASPDNTASSGL